MLRALSLLPTLLVMSAFTHATSISASVQHYPGFTTIFIDDWSIDDGNPDTADTFFESGIILRTSAGEDLLVYQWHPGFGAPFVDVALSKGSYTATAYLIAFHFPGAPDNCIEWSDAACWADETMYERYYTSHASSSVAFAVPEPATLALLGLGVAGLIAARRKN